MMDQQQTETLGELERLRADRRDLLRVLDDLLVQIEPLRYEQHQAIEEACRAKREWADRHNATCGNSNEMWFYMTEYRRSLEAPLEPLREAIREGNRVFDAISDRAAAAAQDGPPFSSDMIPW